MIPQTELAMRGSNGIAKGLERCAGAVVVHLDQEKCILGDTCSRLACTKQQVASSNTNIYYRKSICFGPDGSSLARPSPSLEWARFWKSGDLEIQKFGVQKIKKKSQNSNMF